MRPPTEEDLSLISWQLGREPRGVLAIPKECPYGYPQVILNHPLHRTEGGFSLLPTIFWLTCPFLNREVARLESQGLVKRFEEALEDPELLSAYVSAHEAYRQKRLALLSPEDRAFLEAHGIWEAMETGIAGLRDPRRVKCLHAQLAHFLAEGDNPVGQRVALALPRLFCPPERVLCRGKETGAA